MRGNYSANIKGHEESEKVFFNGYNGSREFAVKLYPI